MRIAVVTSLYPSPERPREGIFADESRLARDVLADATTEFLAHLLPEAPGTAGGP